MNVSSVRGLGLFYAVLGAIAFSGKAIIVKLAYRYGVDAVTLIMLRMAFALPLFLGLAWWAGRDKPPLPGKDLLALFGLGFCGYYLSSFLDFAGLAYITASLERLILYLNPTLVLLISVLVLGQRFARRQLLALAMGYAGLLIAFAQEVSLEGPQVALGAVLVLGAAVSYAVYLVGSGELVQRIGSLRLTGWATSIACLLCIAQFLVLRPVSVVHDLAPEVLWLSVLNATLCTAAPVLLVMMAIERVGATSTAQAGMVGPISTILLGVGLLDEPFTPWLVAGTVLVMAGVWTLGRKGD